MFNCVLFVFSPSLFYIVCNMQDCMKNDNMFGVLFLLSVRSFGAFSHIYAFSFLSDGNGCTRKFAGNIKRKYSFERRKNEVFSH